ncbi:hypothetical protein LTR84_008526 [Exophiala bonariae]|uniref:Transcription factor domain-containing protein n=1 Tax=Exophiala bonariae TaxID=1690606 RepID=A0AAV9MWJ9_9EURO|nr:hypothetical protein LTR84_008526 [Exophiala bonariae]
MIVPTIQLAFDVFHVRNSHNHEFMQWMTKPATSAYHAGAAGLQLLFDMQVSPGCGQTRQCLSHKVKALEYLRQTVSTSPSSVSDDELLVILSLASVERTVDMRAHHYHLEVLAKIVAAQGGLERVADHPKCTISQFDAWWSLSTGSRFFSTPQYLPQPAASAEVMSTRYRDEIKDLPSGFQAVILNGAFSSSIIEILIRLTFVYRKACLERDARGNLVGLPYTARPVWRTFQEACPALDAPGPDTEKLLALAVVLYCGIGFDSAPISSNGGLAARAELFKLLKQDTPPSASTQEEHHFHFWIWVVTICAWQTPSGSGLLPPGIELLRVLRERFPSLTEPRAAEHALGMFFWKKRLTGLLAQEDFCAPRQSA